MYIHNFHATESHTGPAIKATNFFPFFLPFLVHIKTSKKKKNLKDHHHNQTLIKKYATTNYRYTYIDTMCDYEEHQFQCGCSTHKLVSYCHTARVNPDHYCGGVKRIVAHHMQRWPCDRCYRKMMAQQGR
jgi:hypothetical protein